MSATLEAEAAAAPARRGPGDPRRGAQLPGRGALCRARPARPPGGHGAGRAPGPARAVRRPARLPARRRRDRAGAQPPGRHPGRAGSRSCPCTAPDASPEQQRALVPGAGGRRRVVLATDIAETSVTIEGVTTVIDSGLARKPRFHAGSGLTRLVTEPIPLASAEQRAGRAGRLGPGVCYRLWTRAQEVGRAAHRRAGDPGRGPGAAGPGSGPLGRARPGRLRWLDPPPAAAWTPPVELLKDLGALDRRGAITPLGRRLAELPLHPRLGRMLVAAARSRDPAPGRRPGRPARRARRLDQRPGPGTPGGSGSGFRPWRPFARGAGARDGPPPAGG